MSNWFENHQPQRTQISTVGNAPYIQNSNQMASSVNVNRKFSERVLSTPAIFKATSNLFRVTRLFWWQTLTWFSDIFFKICRFRSSILPSLQVFIPRDALWVNFDSGVIFLDQSKFLVMHSNQWDCFILYRQQITSNSFFSCLPKRAKAGGFRVKFWNKKLNLYVFYCIKQIYSMLPCVFSVIDHRGSQNVVRTSVTHSAIASCATFLFLPHFDAICDLLLNRRTATWNLFVKQISFSLVAWRVQDQHNTIFLTITQQTKLFLVSAFNKWIKINTTFSIQTNVFFIQFNVPFYSSLKHVFHVRLSKDTCTGASWHVLDSSCNQNPLPFSVSNKMCRFLLPVVNISISKIVTYIQFFFNENSKFQRKFKSHVQICKCSAL